MSTRAVLYLVALAVVVVGWRIVMICWFPLMACRRCHGDGKRQ